MPKKKKTAKKDVPKEKPEEKPEEKAPQPPAIVTQVVEVVEVDHAKEEEKKQKEAPQVVETKSPQVEEASVEGDSAKDKLSVEEGEESAPETPSTYEEVAEDETERKSKPQEETAADETGADKQKQVVEELFSKRDAGGLTEITIEKGSSKNKLFIWAFIVIVAAATTGVGLILFSGKQPTNLSVFPTKATPTPTAAPTTAPTPVPEVAREDISVQVLNGGGVPGAATKMKDFLTDKGYNVVDVGNAEEYTYAETEILVKSGYEQALSLLKDDISGQYSVGTASATLPDDVSYDARVIVGEE